MNFAEILVILIVALCVFGPEQLPGMARKFARFVVKFKKLQTVIMNEINSEIDKETQNIQLELNEQKAALADKAYENAGESKQQAREHQHTTACPREEG